MHLSLLNHQVIGIRLLASEEIKLTSFPINDIWLPGVQTQLYCHSAIGFPGVVVTGVCKLPNLGARNY